MELMSVPAPLRHCAHQALLARYLDQIRHLPPELDATDLSARLDAELRAVASDALLALWSAPGGAPPIETNAALLAELELAGVPLAPPLARFLDAKTIAELLGADAEPTLGATPSESVEHQP